MKHFLNLSVFTTGTRLGSDFYVRKYTVKSKNDYAGSSTFYTHVETKKERKFISVNFESGTEFCYIVNKQAISHLIWVNKHAYGSIQELR